MNDLNLFSNIGFPIGNISLNCSNKIYNFVIFLSFSFFRSLILMSWVDRIELSFIGSVYEISRKILCFGYLICVFDFILYLSVLFLFVKIDIYNVIHSSSDDNAFIGEYNFNLSELYNIPGGYILMFASLLDVSYLFGLLFLFLHKLSKLEKMFAMELYQTRSIRSGSLRSSRIPFCNAVSHAPSTAARSPNTISPKSISINNNKTNANNNNSNNDNNNNNNVKNTVPITPALNLNVNTVSHEVNDSNINIIINNDKTKTYVEDKEQEIKYDSETEIRMGNMNIQIPDTTKANTGNFVFTAHGGSNVVSPLSIETNTRVVRINGIDNIGNIDNGGSPIIMSMNTITHANNEYNVISPSYQPSVTNASLPDATYMAIAAKQLSQNIVLSSNEASHGAKLNNIYIHDIYHSFHENVRLSGESPIVSYGITPWNSMFDGRGVFGGDSNLEKYYDILLKNYENGLTKDDDDYDDSWKNFKYVGNVLTDSYITMYYFSESWDYTGLLLINDQFYGWIFDDIDHDDDNYPMFNFGCNGDVMQHSGKGLLGLRMDAVYDVEISNIYVYNLFEHTPLGNTFCGEYDGNSGYGIYGQDGGDYEDEGEEEEEEESLSSLTAPGSGGHFRQVIPIQRGFSGNNVQAISIVGAYDIRFSNDIMISNLESYYGEIFGFSVWPASDVTISQGSNMIVSQFESGIKLSDDIIDEYGLTYESRPNRLPESCGIRVENKDPDIDYSAVSMDDGKITFENGIDSSNVITCDMNGKTFCIGDETNGNTLYGDYYNTSNICNDVLINFDDDDFLKQLIVNNNKNSKNNVNFVAISDGYDGDENMVVMFIIVIIVVFFYTYLKQQRKMTTTQISMPQKKITARYGSIAV